MSSAPTPDLRTASVDYRCGDDVLEAYVVTHADGSPRPTVLVCHDWSGQNGGIRAIAERVAALGYTAVALDNYGKGVRGAETADNTHLLTPLLADRALLRRRLLAGVDFARTQAAVDPERVAAIGYCFGGLCVLDLARAGAPLRGVVSFHGIFAPPSLGPQGPIASRVLVLHGWDDPLAQPADVLALAAELTAAGADWQLHAYGHTLHAFTFPGAASPEKGLAYHADAERRSWAAMRAFLAEVLA
ncbi:MAG: dienelactone hydrolase family protein [bacterium]|nr:dienelactone hydrolase family protein [bacterium]